VKKYPTSVWLNGRVVGCIRSLAASVAATVLLLAATRSQAQIAPVSDEPPAEIKGYFVPHPELANDDGGYRSPLKFDDGTVVISSEDWVRRRGEILRYWHSVMGEWPPLLKEPKLELGVSEKREGVTQYPIRIETAPGRVVDDAYLLIPAGNGPFPAVVVVYYEAETGIGRGKSQDRDFAWGLTRRGFVTLSLGGDPNTYYPSPEKCRIQPLSFHAYEAANCCTALSNRPDVDPKRIGIMGHSYGGKWSLFAACLHDRFACAAVSDPGIVFDESRGNVNYWEPWYLGFDPALPAQRRKGIPSEENPRTGPYKQMVADGRDLTELHALMAPRPFFVSGGAEDPPERWRALDHLVQVNDVLGAKFRVAMSNRPKHAPTPESNEVLYRFFEWALQARPPK
jgi:dienelactone hydrolase